MSAYLRSGAARGAAPRSRMSPQRVNALLAHPGYCRETVNAAQTLRPNRTMAAMGTISPMMVEAISSAPRLA
jgi:hypothetical protein